MSDRVRHDLVALMALFATVAFGLTRPAEAFAGFADPAVITVAAILVVGRAVELSGVGAAIAAVAVPQGLPFPLRLAGLLVAAALLSAFMNNIAALVITMPIAAAIARQAGLPPGATLMPLAFATILGGMTTLIGTPANLILSSVRERLAGEPFGFFSMAPVGVAVTVAGLAYLILVGRKLIPVRRASVREAGAPWRVFELIATAARPLGEARTALRQACARPILVIRDRDVLALADTTELRAGDRVQVVARDNQWTVARKAGFDTSAALAIRPDAVTARVVVAHGSMLEGLSHEAIRTRSGDALQVVAAGPAAGRRRAPLASARIASGDQLFIRGAPGDLAAFLAPARLLEIDRIDPVPLSPARAGATVAIFAAAIAAIVIGGLSPAVAFAAAAALLAAVRLLPGGEVYRSIDWTIVVLLGAMIPVGESFETSGAADIVAGWLAHLLGGSPLILVTGALCALTLLLSIFLNNVATAVVMGPLAIDLAADLGVSPDAALLAVLIGASADFLTPIGHHNNLLVMSAGGYRFGDYARVGAPMVLIVVGVTAFTLSRLYG